MTAALATALSDLTTLREQRGISLGQIVNNTKIRLHYLEVIEAGQFVKLPGGNLQHELYPPVRRVRSVFQRTTCWSCTARSLTPTSPSLRYDSVAGALESDMAGYRSRHRALYEWRVSRPQAGMRWRNRPPRTRGNQIAELCGVARRSTLRYLLESADRN